MSGSTGGPAGYPSDYGRGAAEEAWGEILADHDRDSYVLATKVYFPMSDVDRGLSAEQIHKQIDASLKRLRTGYVDLYQCHRYDTDTPPEGTRAASEEMGGFIAGCFRDEVLEAVQRLAPISEQAGLSPAQLALAWILRQPNVASAIIGATAARAGRRERRRLGGRARRRRPAGDRRGARGRRPPRGRARLTPRGPR